MKAAIPAIRAIIAFAAGVTLLLFAIVLFVFVFHAFLLPVWNLGKGYVNYTGEQKRIDRRPQIGSFRIIKGGGIVPLERSERV